MANLMNNELMDELSAPSGVTHRPEKDAPSPVSELTQKVPSALPAHPGVSLVSASAVKSATKKVPPPPRPALKTQVRASVKPIDSPQVAAPKATAPMATAPRATAPKATAPDALDMTDVTEVKPLPPPSEKTLIFRPNLSDPTLRRSKAAEAQSQSRPEELSIPKEPRLPADVVAAAGRSSLPNSLDVYPPQTMAFAADDDGNTVTLSADAMDRLLETEAASSRSADRPAEEATRVGQVPVEMLLALQRRSSHPGVGNDDVTRVYDSPLHEKQSEVTAPGQRQSRHPASAQDIATQLRVIVQQEPQKSRVGWYVFLGLCVAALGAGWAYRAPLGKQAHMLQDRIARGIGASTAGQGAVQVAAVPMVAVSVSVSPADARLTLDGASITNPYSAQLRSDKQLHQLVAEAPGHVTLSRGVLFERDLTVMLALAPKPQAKAAEVAAAEAAAVPAPVDNTVAAPAPARIVVQRRAKVAPSVPAPEPAPVLAPEPATVAAAKCNPPYTVDAAGIKAFKPECM